jgi:antitoxin (DNA-binding transcriptional repressor) of toxin-antitoxin stability system
MTMVSISKAKKYFYEYAKLVEEGERICVTRYGKPFFDMVPLRMDSTIETADEKRISEAPMQVGPIIP